MALFFYYALYGMLERAESPQSLGVSKVDAAMWTRLKYLRSTSCSLASHVTVDFGWRGKVEGVRLDGGGGA